MRPGYYGKLPVRGDFLGAGLSRSFTEGWDLWLQEGLAEGRRRLGPHWEDAYLESPVWRFLVRDPAPQARGLWIGLLMPSVDGVGRHFPITVAWELPGGEHPYGVLARLEDALLALEARLLALLDQQDYTLDAFVDAVSMEVEVSPSVELHRERTLDGQAGLASLWAASEFLDHVPYAGDVWWTLGSDRSPARLQLGSIDAAIELFDVASVPPRPGLEENPVAAIRRSEVFSYIGERRENQDRWVRNDDGGLWAVVDGMGGHRDGAAAAERIAAELAEARLEGTLHDRVAAVRSALQRAHDRLSARSAADDVSGAAVAALVLHGASAVMIWCGDVRIYRLSTTGAERLTDDHDAPGLGEGVLSRAVGVGAELRLEERLADASGRTAFLLCSDGVYRNPEFEQALGSGRDPTSAFGLLSESLRDARGDNATAVLAVVDGASEGPDP